MKEKERVMNKVLSMFVIGILVVSLVPMAFAQQFKNPISGSRSTAISKIQSFSPKKTMDVSYSSASAGRRAGKDSEFFDMQVYIPPAGCEPTIVRSDLLEEQNVPVYCKVSALGINPGVDISRIARIQPRLNERNPYISGISFHPANEVVARSRGAFISTPTEDNLGYVVVNLRRQQTEAQMPDVIKANLSVVLEYDARNTFGIGQSEFIIPIFSDQEFQNEHKEYGFFNGIGYLRVESIDGVDSRLGIYSSDLRYQQLILKKDKLLEIFMFLLQLVDKE
jgi:hypothetical protein